MVPAVQTSRAVILRTWEFGEADLLVGFFTPEMGRLKGVAKAARRSRKRFVNCLDHFCLVTLEHVSRRSGELRLIHSGGLLEGFPGIRGDFRTFSLAGYLVELTEALFPPGVAAPEMFDLLVSTLGALDRGDEPACARIAFEARAMALGGYAIDLGCCGLCGRKYQGKGRALFDRDKGRIYCLKCGAEAPGVSGFGAEAGSLLRALQSGGCADLPMETLEAPAFEEIRNVLDLHMACRLGRRMKSAVFLD